MNIKMIMIILFGVFCMFESTANPNMINLFFVVVGIATLVMFAKNLYSIAKSLEKANKEMMKVKE